MRFLFSESKLGGTGTSVELQERSASMFTFSRPFVVHFSSVDKTRQHKTMDDKIVYRHFDETLAMLRGNDASTQASIVKRYKELLPKTKLMPHKFSSDVQRSLPSSKVSHFEICDLLAPAAGEFRSLERPLMKYSTFHALIP